MQAYGVAASTRWTYYAGIISYLAFCSKYSINPLPASELTLHYFCAKLSNLVTHATIKVYPAGICLFHIENNFPDPTKEAPLLCYLCTAIRRYAGETNLKCLPITIPILCSIKANLSHRHHMPSQDRQLFWAAFTLTFYGFLRASEYTSPTPTRYNRRLHLLKKDITIHKDRMTIRIKGSITDQFRRSTSILISKTSTSTCPVRAMKHFIKYGHHHRSLPLYTFQDGTFLIRHRVSMMTKSLISSKVSDTYLYSSHSYQIGAATAAAAAGIPDSLIQILGRWHSNAYRSYIRISPKVLCNATRLIATHKTY